MNKNEIQYPTEWSYKIIGSDENKLKDAVAECLGDKKYNLARSNKSSGGKYVSFNVSLIVSSEDMRNEIFVLLSNHSSVKVVI